MIFVTPEVINPNSPVNRAMIRQDITRFNRDFQHGYFVPGVGHDPNRVGYPNFTTHVAPTAATKSAPPCRISTWDCWLSTITLIAGQTMTLIHTHVCNGV